MNMMLPMKVYIIMWRFEKYGGIFGIPNACFAFDLDKQMYNMDVDLPMLRIESQYNVTGKIVMMPVKGAGPMEANVTDCKAKVFLQGELYDKNGQQFLRFSNMSLKVNVGNGLVIIKNLFNGDKMLNEIVNDVLNKNLDAFMHELMPIIERALSAAFLNIINKIIERFTYDQLFPV